MRNHEEDYLPDYRKERKLQRKIASKTDRSKYKKTDINRLNRVKKERLKSTGKQENLIRGRVTSIVSEVITVDCNGYFLSCLLRGVLKKERTRVKNLIVVGDFVLIEKQNETEGSIVVVEPRKSVLSRADSLSQRKQHILAANIDQVLITCSVGLPALKIPLIDRYIIATQKGNMEPVIVINKIDLLSESQYPEELRLYQEILKAYTAAGLRVISVSSQTGFGLDELKDAMRGKASVFAGQSGTGKSSLINALTGLNLTVGETVDKTRKGSHTTTRAHLVPLSFGGWCIDTPGVKSFGIWDIEKEEVQAYYNEIKALSPNCRYTGCTHTHEPECAVIAAVEANKISPLRYYSYCALMSTIEDEDHLRR